MGDIEEAALAFFRDAAAAVSLDQLANGFAAVVEPMRLSSAACFHALRPGEPVSIRLAFSWNLARADVDRARRRLSQADVAVNTVLMSSRITPWSDLEDDLAAPSGWLIPVHGPLGETLCLAVFGCTSEPLDDRGRMILQVAGSLFASHGLALAEIEGEASPSPYPTSRENACAYWAGQGKSDWQIGQILNISEGAVAFHLTSLARKLKLKGRSQIPGLYRRMATPARNES